MPKGITYKLIMYQNNYVKKLMQLNYQKILYSFIEFRKLFYYIRIVYHIVTPKVTFKYVPTHNNLTTV